VRSRACECLREKLSLLGTIPGTSSFIPSHHRSSLVCVAGVGSSIDGDIHEAFDSIQRGDTIQPDDTIHLGAGSVPAAKGMEETFAERKQADDSLMVQRVLNLRYKSDPARHYAYQRLHPLLNPDRSPSHLHVTWESASSPFDVKHRRACVLSLDDVADVARGPFKCSDRNSTSSVHSMRLTRWLPTA